MERVSPLGDLDDFAPKPSAPAKDRGTQRQIVDRLAVDNNFPSRQPPPLAGAPLRTQRRFTTGRNTQKNIKATVETIDEFNRLADELNVPLGEVLRISLIALREKLESQSV